MFKKPLKIIEEEEPVLLTQKDRKKLKQTIQKQFDERSVDKFFEYYEELVMPKLEKSKVQLYMAGKDPVLVDASGKGDFFPSVYALSLLPELIKVTFHVDSLAKLLELKNQVPLSAVKNLKSLPDFKADDVLGIMTPKGNVVAVAAASYGKKELEELTDPDEIVAMIIHFKDDNLSQLGSQVFKQKIYPLDEPVESLKEEPAKEKSKKVADDDDSADDGKDALLAIYQLSTKGAANKNMNIVGEALRKQPQAVAKPKGAPQPKKPVDDSDNDKKDAKKKGGKGDKETKKGKGHADSDDEKKDSKKNKGKDAKHKQKDSDSSDSDDDKKAKKGDKKDQKEKPKGGEKKAKDGDSKAKSKGQKDKKDAVDNDKEDSCEEIQEEKRPKAAPGKEKEAPAARSKKETDDLVLEAFLNATAVKVDDSELPMDIKQFFNKYVLPCKTCREPLDIRNSSYGSIKKFFTWLANQKMIEFKEAGKKDKEDEVLSINRDHKKIDGYEPTINKPSEDDADKSDNEGKEIKLEMTKEVTNLYQVPAILKPYLSKLTGGEYVGREEFEKQIRDWLKKENLLLKDSVQINKKLDDDFEFIDDEDFEAEEANSPQTKEPQAKNDEAHPAEGDGEEAAQHGKKAAKSGPKLVKWSRFLDTLEQKLKKVFRIKDLKGPAETFKDGTFDGIGIYSEKAHGKTITRINMLELLGFDPKILFGALLKKFETTGEIHDHVVEKQRVKEITLNGAFAEDVKDYLEGELRVPERYINLVDKLVLKKGKRGPMNQQ